MSRREDLHLYGKQVFLVSAYVAFPLDRVFLGEENFGILFLGVSNDPHAIPIIETGAENLLIGMNTFRTHGGQVGYNTSIH